MANGVKKLRKIQIGFESSAGTAVSATNIWRGTGTIEDGAAVTQAPEDVGYLIPVERVYVPTTEASLAMDPTPANFEQIGYIFQAGIDGATSSGSRDSSGGYVYTFGMATTAQKTPRTFTIEGGDNNEAERFAYGFVTDFTLTGAPREALQVAANWKGREVSPHAFTAGLTLQSVETIVFSNASLYIDDVTAVANATTEVSHTLLGFTLTINTGFMPVYTSHGDIFFDFVKQVEPVVTLDVTFEHNASATAEKAKWRALTQRMIRLRIDGSAIANGDVYDSKTLIVDLAGHWETFSKIDEQDGNDIVTGRFVATLATGANPDLFCNVILVNNLASLV